MFADQTDSSMEVGIAQMLLLLLAEEEREEGSMEREADEGES